MPEVVLMPALSPTMTEGHLTKWHKSVGDKVSPGDLLMDVETDKAVMEVEATQGGILARILVPAPTESVPIGRPLAYLRQEGETDEDLPPEEAVQAEVPKVREVEPQPPSPSQPAPALQGPAQAGSRIKASPLAKKIAHQRGIDLSLLTGSGPRGRILKKDLDQTVDQTALFQEEKTSSQAQPNKLPLTAMRKVIAQRLSHSKQTIPHFYVSIDCEMDALLALRQKLNEAWGEKVLSVNDCVAAACAKVLAEIPEMRTLWGEQELIRYPHVDLAVAVSLEGGLITPIVRAAERKTLKELALELKGLIARAREGKLKPEEYQGGIFTLSNLGISGVSHFQPIINPPHSGILAIGTSLAKPVVREGKVEVAQVMTATIAADHRVVDGEVAARFLGNFKKMIEAPYSLLS